MSETQISQSNSTSLDKDLLYWAKMGRWNFHETVILSLGGDPKVITIERIREVRRTDKYDDRARMITRAIESNTLDHWCCPYRNRYHLYPLSFVRWAKQFDIDLPEQFAEKVFFYHQARDFKSLYEQEVVANSVLKEEVNSLKQENSRSALEEKPLHTKEKETLLKIIAAIVVDAYGYDPLQEKNKSLADIRNALDQTGCSLDDDTIRNKLQQAGQFIPQGFLKNKPK